MLKEELIAAGADRAEILPVSGIPFEPSLLSLCAENRCGNYNKCWTCPPSLACLPLVRVLRDSCF